MPTFSAAQFNGHAYVSFDGIDDTLFKAAANGFTSTTGQIVSPGVRPWEYPGPVRR